MSYVVLRRPVMVSSDALLHAAGSEMLAQIAGALGVPVPPLALSRAVDNAQADGIGIVINPDWLHAAMNAVCGDPSCLHDMVIGILGHELGHLVHFDVWAPPWAKRSIELRADWFAGIACARLGVSAEGFAAIIWRIADRHSSGPTSYPDRNARVRAIRAGFEQERHHQLVTAHYWGQLAALEQFGWIA